MQDLLLLSRNDIIAKVANGNIEPVFEHRLPFLLSRTGNIETWLESRAIDSQRINSRILKRALKLTQRDDISTVLSVNAATITDNFWVKPIDDSTTRYEDVRFKKNAFDKLALYGDVSSFAQQPSRTPELTNTGSYEKCWSLEEDGWWMYKSGNNNELFSELLIYKLGKYLNFNMAEYRASGKYIKTKDFTNNANIDFEPIYGLVGESTEYKKVFDKLNEICPEIADEYIKMCYLDGIFFNMDRHEKNFGILRDVETGKILSLAPFYDHNIALVARGFPKSTNDVLISDFTELLQYSKNQFSVKMLTEQIILEKIKEVPFKATSDSEIQNPEKYMAEYIVRRQTAISEQGKNLYKWT